MSVLDRCIFVSQSGGTTDFIVAAPVLGYQTPSAAGAVNGVTYSYAAQSADLVQWEVGTGVYSTSTSKLVRNVLSNSLGTTAKINFQAAPQVMVTVLAKNLSPNVFSAIPTDAGIRAAYNNAVAAGGGIILIPAATITLTSSLPWSSGITYKGSSYQVSQLTVALGGSYGGTILQGDGTFTAIAANSTDQITAPSSYSTWINGMVKGGGFEDISFYNFTDGIKIGALYNPGCQFTTFRNLHFDTCSNVALDLENCQECVIDHIYIESGGAGTFRLRTSGSTVDYTGNTKVSNVLVYGLNATTRGMIFQARDDGTNTNPTQLNFVVGDALQAQLIHTGGGEIVQLASTTSSNADIGVVNNADFPVDLPVTVDTATADYTPNQIYFVVYSASNKVHLSDTQGGSAKVSTVSTTTTTATFSNTLSNIAVADATKFPVNSSVVLSANVGTAFTAGTQYWVVFSDSGLELIRLSATKGGAAITSDANGTSNISTWFHLKSKGFPGIEMVGLGSSVIQTCGISNLDLEGNQSTNVLMQNCTSCPVSGLFVDTASSYRTFTVRNSVDCILNPAYPFNYDLDAGSSSTIINGSCSEILPTVNTTSGNTPSGLGGRVNSQSGTTVAQNSFAFFVGGFNKPDLYLNSSTFALQTASLMDTRVTYSSNPTFVGIALSGTQFDNIGATSEVDFTLPSCTAAMAGMKFGFYVGAAQTLKVIAPASTTIRVAANVSMSAGNITNATIGSYIELTCVAANTYVAKSFIGTWTVT